MAASHADLLLQLAGEIRQNIDRARGKDVSLSICAALEDGAKSIQENERFKAIEQAAIKLLFDNGGPTGGFTYFDLPDEFVLARIKYFQALEAAVRANEPR